jgi:hypothetical protein
MKINKYSGVNKNIALFDQYAREIVAGMLLYNSITMQYKSLMIQPLLSLVFPQYFCVPLGSKALHI